MKALIMVSPLSPRLSLQRTSSPAKHAESGFGVRGTCTPT